MADIVNLRQARKARRRITDEQQAQANRLVFGRTKVEREQTAREGAMADRHLEGHRREETS